MIYSSDWLGIKPHFYTFSDAKPSPQPSSLGSNINDDDIQIFLEMGYSAYGTTLNREIRFCNFDEQIVEVDSTFKIEKKVDPVLDHLDYRLSESDIIRRILDLTEDFLSSTDGQIVLPLSNGLDSRLLAWALTTIEPNPKKERIRTFTYSSAITPSLTNETFGAKKIANSLKLAWEPIYLNKINNHVNDWYKSMGVTTHAHGMYHLDFYSQIKERLTDVNEVTIVSGIDGDLWAGTSPSVEVKTPFQLFDLNYAHGISIETSRKKNEVLEAWFTNNEKLLELSNFRTVSLIRNKNMLNRYLFKIPQSLDFDVWSPFTDMELCLAMLNLDPNRRKDRIWQREHFLNVGLPFGDSRKSPFRYNQDIDLRAHLQKNLPLIEVNELPSEELQILGDEVNLTLKNVAKYPLLPIFNSISQSLVVGLIKFSSNGTANATAALDAIKVRPRKPKFRDAYSKWSILHPLTIKLDKVDD